MYLKLAFRNAKRSIFDYLLYITTMTILIAIMCISNYIAVFGDMQARFQTASLPLLIVLIMVALVNYINTFMMKQRQIVELKWQAKNICVLYYMGKSQAQIKSLIKTQLILNLLVPTLMYFVLLWIGVPFINHKMNMALPIIMQNSLIKAVAGFVVCFAILYLCYFLIVYIISKHYVKTVIKLKL